MTLGQLYEQMLPAWRVLYGDDAEARLTAYLKKELRAAVLAELGIADLLASKGKQ